MRNAAFIVFIAGALLLTAPPGFADSITVTATGTQPNTGSTLTVSAVFTTPGNGNLQIVLTNSSTGPSVPRGNILADLFWTVRSADPTLALNTTLNSGS